MALSLSPRARYALRIVGYVVLGFLVFIYALHLTFPYERIKDRVIEGLASKYDVSIGKVERSMVPGRFALTNVTLRSRPSVVGQPVTTMFFKRIEVDVAFLPLISGKAEIGLDVSTGNGRMSGTVKASKSSLAVDIKLTRVPLATLPGIADAVGLPLGGAGDGHVRLNLPKNDWTKASGSVRLSCTVGCTVGDDVSRVYPKARREADQLMVKDGIPIKTINVSRFVLGLKIAKGEAEKEVFEFESPDGDIELDVNIKFAKKMADSVITGCIRYKCAPDYQKKAPAACDLGSPVVDNDGFHNIKLTGKLTTMKRLGAVCDAGGDGGDDRDRGDDAFTGGGIDKSRRDRPSLDVVEPPTRGTGEGTGTGAATGMMPPVEMGKPMPMGDDVNRAIDAGTPDVGGAAGTAGGAAAGTGGASGVNGATGVPMPEVVEPPPIQPGEPAQPEPVQPEGASGQPPPEQYPIK
jgi:type II secretion system protein N